MRLFEAQVKKGVALLDRHKPSWRNKIKEDTLNLSQCENCILGQVWGNIYQATHILEKMIPDIFSNGYSPADYGFDLTDEAYVKGGVMQEYSTLTNEWKRHL